MNIAKTINRIRNMQEKYISLENSIKSTIKNTVKPLEKYLKKRLQEEYPGINFYLVNSFQCGSLTTAWKPEVYIYEVNDLSYCSEGYWFTNYSPNNKTEKYPAPLQAKKLRQFLKTLTDEVGVNVVLSCKKPLFSYHDEEESLPKFAAQTLNT